MTAALLADITERVTGGWSLHVIMEGETRLPPAACCLLPPFTPLSVLGLCEEELCCLQSRGARGVCAVSLDAG